MLDIVSPPFQRTPIRIHIISYDFRLAFCNETMYHRHNNNGHIKETKPMKSKLTPSSIVVGGLLSATLLSAGLLISVRSYADNDSAVDDVAITVPVSCTMSGNIATGQEHTATLQPGTYSGASGSAYENGIGKTTLATFCNDYNGFTIYAIGFTGETAGDNTLVGTSTSGGATINTKVYESTDTTSNWSMRVNKVDDSTQAFNPNNMSITNSFNTWHVVPDNYAKVAEYHASTGSSATDQSLGAKVETTYAAFVSTSQPADTYTSKVKYVIVHPSTAPAPFMPHEIECEAETICYNVNADPAETEGTMGTQDLHNRNIDWSSCGVTDYSTYCINYDYQSIDVDTLPRLGNYRATLTASDYSRPNYGFAGWNTAYDYSGTSYGPNETIALENSIAEAGLSLYAIWVPVARDNNDNELTFQTPNFKTVVLKDGDTLNDKPNGYVTALRDIRDDDVYAIAKLADGQYWMIENLRLDNTANITTSNTQSNNGSWGGGFIGLADPEPLNNFSYRPIANSLYGPYSSTVPRYNNDNTKRANGAEPYSYGNYYSWPAAVADASFYSADGEMSISSTSICSSGWRLPKDDNDSDFQTLYSAMTDNVPDSIAAQYWRKYPNNYLDEANYVSSTIYNVAYGDTYACRTLIIGSGGFYLTNNERYGYYSLRCIAE